MSTPAAPPGSHPTNPRNSAMQHRWAAHLGIAAFAFFLLKGLAWLVVPVAVAALAAR